MKWNIKKINNKNSKYDFRIKATNNNYSNINFFKYTYFRILVSLSSHLTYGIILFNKNFYKLEWNKKIPAIFNFSLNKTSDKKNYITLNENISKLFLKLDGIDYTVNTLTKPETKIFQSLYLVKDVNNILKFIKKNKKSYTHVNKNQLYIVTGFIQNNNVILDLLEFNKKENKSILTRCKINDTNFKNQILDYKDSTYCIFLLKFEETLKINFFIPITYDEYLSYIYDLMLPCKFDFNDIDIKKSNMKSITYDNMEEYAFAIDPNGSKDRDDAIACFYYKDNKYTTTLEDATHIKLNVHISNTLPYIVPENNNYYYHYCKYKSNTDYLDRFNLPMMDRILSENKLSLDGPDNDAITIELLYKIKDKKSFVIYPFPENVNIHQTKKLKVFGTTYQDFASSFNLNPKKGFSNKEFNKRYIINCNNIERDFNEFIYEGDSVFKSRTKKMLANNLKQLYIFFVNSLNHTGKDSLLKVPNNLVRSKGNIFLEFSPTDMWAHSLVEYTALESNIYFSHLMFMISKYDIKDKKGIFEFNYDDILKNIELVGKKNINLLAKNINNKSKIKSKPLGIFRNLFTPIKDREVYLNDKIVKMLKISIENPNEDISKFLKKYNYTVIKNKSNITTLLKLLLALRQILLILNAKSNLEISYGLISKELKMKAKYDLFPFWHIDIATLFYTHATSPMRRFVDINVHHFIFNKKHRDYIFRNLDLDGINLSVGVGKSIHQLVNNERFVEFIMLNKPVMRLIDINDRIGLYGFNEIINFYSFNKIKKLNNKPVNLRIDNYGLPYFVKSNKKLFNLYYHMLKNENQLNDKIKDKVKKFLTKILKVKKIDKIC